MSRLKDKLTDDMKAAMSAKEKERLATVRSILAAIKQQEVDTRQDLSDDDILSILTKLSKQRKESISQFEKAERFDLVAIEKGELDIIETYLPQQLSPKECEKHVDDAISQVGATSAKDMGKVMGVLTGKLKGVADMGVVSQLVKSRLQ